MTKLKIRSNPYEKKTEFFRFDETENSWNPVNPNSKLICKEYSEGFFPFKIKDIIEKIIEEYDDGENFITIVFEGTDDEYKELTSLCLSDKYSHIIKIEKSALYIENARKILPDIIEIFKELKPTINDSIDEKNIRNDVKRFSDASSDIIPICVIGNYSAGKSTFINALIGCEILPSGENPVTAKIFKIIQSEKENYAKITVQYNNSPIEIIFDECKCGFSVNPENNKLVKSISDIFDSVNSNVFYANINKALCKINEFKAECEGTDPIGNMIEIKIPFHSYFSEKVKMPFMIFDTPGSNSASNLKHLEVLRDAMHGMSNGIPIFVSDSKLDTTDNEKLFNVIKDIKNLDNRFTMIIVNKSDRANLPSKGFSKDDEKKILRQFIPQKLYSGGIYYTSSVMGLGSKTGGVFSDEFCAEVFEDEKEKYTNPDEKFYKSLYKYNIMPDQIKEKCIAEAKAQPNLIFANSGLFSIEKDIVTFAEKYSSYDKCKQSQHFLNEILEKTKAQIIKKKEEAEERKSNSIDLFKKHKKDLINKLDNNGNNFFESAKNEYIPFMTDVYASCESKTEKSELKNKLENITDRLKSEKGYEQLKNDLSASRKTVMSNLLDNSRNSIKDKFNKESIKVLNKELNDNRKVAKEDSEELKEVKKEISELASDGLLQEIIALYSSKTESAQTVINNLSIQYWTSKAEEAKKLLLDIVSDSSGINNDELEKLSKIILEYPELVLFYNNAEEIFTVENFKKRIVFGDVTKLKLEKLSDTYNKDIKEFVDNIKSKASDDHSSGFHSWLGTLLSSLKENIVSYNQILRDEQYLIKKLVEEIETLEQKEQSLTNGSAKIDKMIAWKQ